MKVKYKILLVDDHKLFREGLAFVISQMPEYEVVGDASNGWEFLEMIDKLKADIIFMDVSMPGIDGITATVRALEKYPDLKIIALTMYSDKEYYYKMVQAGVFGFLLKESGMEEISKALKTIISGEKYFSQKLLQKIIFNSKISMGNLNSIARQNIKLTIMEIELLKLICQGFSTQQASEKLALSPKTITDCKVDLFKKTGAKNSVKLAIFAIKNNLVEI